MATRIGSMATDRPARYAKQLASHWAARGETSEVDGATVMNWHDGRVIVMRPEDGGLRVEVSVPDESDLERFSGVVARHLERFGQRDELTVVWA